MSPVAEEDKQLGACVDLLAKTGAQEVQIRYSDDEQPVIWMAAGRWEAGWQVACSLVPLQAVFGLLEMVIDGGQCAHCGRTSGVTLHFDSMPMKREVCWYQYDPELSEFRRACE